MEFKASKHQSTPCLLPAKEFFLALSVSPPHSTTVFFVVRNSYFTCKHRWFARRTRCFKASSGGGDGVLFGASVPGAYIGRCIRCTCGTTAHGSPCQVEDESNQDSDISWGPTTRYRRTSRTEVQRLLTRRDTLRLCGGGRLLVTGLG